MRMYTAEQRSQESSYKSINSKKGGGNGMNIDTPASDLVTSINSGENNENGPGSNDKE